MSHPPAAPSTRSPRWTLRGMALQFALVYIWWWNFPPSPEVIEPLQQVVAG